MFVVCGCRPSSFARFWFGPGRLCIGTRPDIQLIDYNLSDPSAINWNSSIFRWHTKLIACISPFITTQNTLTHTHKHTPCSRHFIKLGCDLQWTAIKYFELYVCQLLATRFHIPWEPPTETIEMIIANPTEAPARFMNLMKTINKELWTFDKR